MKSIQLVVFFLLTLYLYTNAASSPCSATIAPTPRPNSSWTSGIGSFEIYDIVVINAGSCPILSLFSLFNFSGSQAIQQAWNYNSSSGVITGFGGYLPAGKNFTAAGFILSGAPGGIPHTTGTPTCDCTGVTATSGTATTASSTGSSSTSGSSTTGVASSCSSVQCLANQICVVATHGPQCFYRSCSDAGCAASQVCIDDGGVARCINETISCDAAITITARPGSSFVFAGELSQIYDLDVSNIGQALVTRLQIQIQPVAGTHVVENNKWNLVKNASLADVYDVTTFGALSLSGAHYHGAGFVLAGTNATTATPSVSIYSVSC